VLVPFHVRTPLAKVNPSALGAAGLIVQVGVFVTPLTVNVAVPEVFVVESIFLEATVRTASRASATVTIAVAIAVVPLTVYVPFIK
jgi:hypothetical protein